MNIILKTYKAVIGGHIMLALAFSYLQFNFKSLNYLKLSIEFWQERAHAKTYN